MKFKLISISLLAACSFSSHAHQLQASVNGGMLISSLSNNKSVEVSSGVYNDYVTDEDTKAGAIGGLSLMYVFKELGSHPIDFSLGLSGYYLNYSEINGLEHPIVNGGNFDTLNYSMQAMSVALLLEPKVIFTRYAWQPYVFAGVGPSWNRLYDYEEKATNFNGGASPAPYPFRNKTQSELAYEVGFGVQKAIAENPHHHFKYLVSFDYRYMNLGEAALGTMRPQDTRDHLEVSPLSTQALVLSVTTLF